MAETLTEAIAAPDTPEPVRDDDRWIDRGIGVGLFAFTIISRLPRLGRPSAFVFDEIYYALDSADILRRGVERGGVVHPPVGKWLIAIGVRVDGFTPVGWRLAALVVGALVVVLTFAAARQVVANRWLAGMAGLLVALDGVAYTTGRVAMLDVFVALFTMVAVWCTLAALKRSADQVAVTRYRWGAAVALGLGIGVKWTTGYVLLVVLIGFLVVDSRQPPDGRRIRRLLRTVLVIGAVPVAVYVACYIPWLINIDKTYAGVQACTQHQECSYSLTDRVRLLVEDQQRILKFHTGLLSDNNSNADFAIKWADQASPSVLYRQTCIAQLQKAPPALDDGACTGAADGDVVEIVTVANPIVWFGSLVAIIGVGVTMWKKRDAAHVLVVAFFLYQWFPWVLDPFGIKDAITQLSLHPLVQERRAYSFYLAPMISVVAIWPAIALDRRRLKWLAVPLVAAAVVAFAFYLPVWQGRPLSPHQIDVRQWWDVFST